MDSVHGRSYLLRSPESLAAMPSPENVEVDFDPQDTDDISLALVSEEALSDWNSPEEDAAWAHLQMFEEPSS
jgi:hypothetical protein